MNRSACIFIIFCCVFPAHLTAANLEGFTCDKVRPTGSSNNHRTLHVPASMWDSADVTAREWAEKLCCVYTWSVRNAGIQTPYMVTYDGGAYQYRGASTYSNAAQR